MITQKKRLYRILFEQGLLSEKQLQELKILLEENAIGTGGFGEHLFRLGYLNEEQYIAFLKKECGYHYFNPNKMKIDPLVFKEIPGDTAKRLSIIPLKKTKNVLAVAMSDPFNERLLDELKQVTACKVLPIISCHGEIRQALERYRSFFKSKTPINKEIKLTGYEGLPLVSRFNFKSFIIGKGNEFSHAVAQAAAKSPGEKYNPLFIYGDVGLGKTHLLNAVGNEICSNKGSARIMYVTCEYFNTKLAGAIKDNLIDRFRLAFNKIDVLLIDDIEFLCGREKTQEEFFHLFNSMIQAGKQVALTSDRSPRDLSALEDRLRSRFLGGTLAGIKPLDLETKLAILAGKTGVIAVSNEVLQFMAGRIPSSIRDLEGALNTLASLNRFTGEKINIELAEKVLEEMGY